MSTQPVTAGQEWQKHWPLVFAGLLGMSFYSIITYTLGTFIEPLEQEFGWSRATISAGLMIFTITATIGGPLIGAVIDKIGTRKVAVPGIALHALAFAVTAKTMAFSPVQRNTAQVDHRATALGARQPCWFVGQYEILTAGTTSRTIAVITSFA